jgi:NDP-sugar pyrophosphorylase family protein
MKPTLVILAAGMGSRYGGLKQLDEVGPNGEAIIDYSLFDAIRAGFGKVVFVIREDFAKEFKERFASNLDGRIETEYVYQAIGNIPAGIATNPDRQKPWGTGHAFLMAEQAVNEPVAVINADDFYGEAAYSEMVNFLTSSEDDKEYSMVGYKLQNTLSEFGSVSRGVCESDSSNLLTAINERTQIESEGDNIFYYEDGKKHPLTGKETVSMNFWGVKPELFKKMRKGFEEFLTEQGMELKSEFFFPFFIDEIIKKGEITTRVLKCDSPWFGVTYKEDKPFVQNKIKELINEGAYPEELWAKV